jgi:hypothetical protein
LVITNVGFMYNIIVPWPFQQMFVK